MIVRCEHLRAIGLLTPDCCPHCHGPAGCVGGPLSTEHQFVHCCARTAPFTNEEITRILACVPIWEARMGTPMYTQRLQSFLRESAEKLKEARAQGRQRNIQRLQCTIGRIEQLLQDVGAPFDSDAPSS